MDLSFIEKANFGQQMKEAGYKGPAISAALHIEKTVISPMLSAAERITVYLVEAICPAPALGFPRWLALADVLEARGGDCEVLTLVDASGKRPQTPALRPCWGIWSIRRWLSRRRMRKR